MLVRGWCVFHTSSALAVLWPDRAEWSSGRVWGHPVGRGSAARHVFFGLSNARLFTNRQSEPHTVQRQTFGIWIPHVLFIHSAGSLPWFLFFSLSELPMERPLCTSAWMGCIAFSMGSTAFWMGETRVRMGDASPC